VVRSIQEVDMSIGKPDEFNPLELLINEIQHTMDQNCYIASLFLALAIPDICGQIAYPNLTVRKGKRNIQEQYIKWFDGHVDYSIYDAKDEFAHFSGELCYALRCSIMHTGSTDIGKKFIDLSLNDFNFILESKNEYELYIDEFEIEESNEGGNKTVKRFVQINIRSLCKAIIFSAKRFYKLNKDLVDKMPVFKLRNLDSERLKIEELRRINDKLNRNK